MTDKYAQSPFLKTADSAPRVRIRRFGVALLLGLLLAGSFLSAVSGQVKAAPVKQAATHIVISEFRFEGSAGSDDEFVEIFNPTGANVDISAWNIRRSSNTASGSISTRFTFPGVAGSNTTIIQPGQHYLIVRPAFDDGVVSDGTLSGGVAADGGIAVTLPNNTVVDAVGFSANAASAFGGVLLTALPGATDQSYERLPGGAYGSCYDTDNASDFVMRNITDPANPQNSSIVYDPCSISLLYTPTSTLTSTPTQTDTSTLTQTLTPTTTSTPTSSSTPTITSTPVPGNTSTHTLTPTITLTPLSQRIIINEVAWAGTNASSSDEWIELYNPGLTPVNLNGWKLVIGGTTTISLSNKTVLGGGYYLVEHDENTTDVPSDQIPSSPTISLLNAGDTIILKNSLDVQVDTANINGGAWPAGSASPKCSMERASANALDNDSGWFTNNNVVHIALDSANNPICGTPKNLNWAYSVTATPTLSFTATKTLTRTKTPTITKTPSKTKTPTKSKTPTKTLTPTITKTRTKTVTPTKSKTPTPYPLVVSSVVINEFLVQPRSDWNGDGKVDSGDSFIEIKNLSTQSISVSGWWLDDQNGDSSPYYLPSLTLEVGARAVFFQSETNIILSEASDSVRLFRTGSASAISDAYTYTGGVKVPNQSWCRLPDGGTSWTFGCEPTPKLENKLAQTIVVNNQSELTMCLSTTTPAVVYEAECLANGLAIWSPFYWGGELQTGFPLYIQRDELLDVIE